MITAKREQGIAISEADQQWLDRSDKMKSLAETEIQNLNSQIKDLKEEKIKYKKAEAATKLDKLTSGYATDYMSY